MSGIYPKALKWHDVKPAQPASEPANDVAKKAPFDNARYVFDNLNSFSIWVKSELGGEIRFVLIRDSLTWKLSNIVLPI